MAIIVVKNTTGSEVFISDLGIGVDGSGQLNLSELFEFEDISGSDDLKSFVQNGTFTVNDGVVDLSLQDGLNHIYHQTVYEDSFEDGGGALIAEQLHGVQIRRTTDLSLSTSWQDVTFDTTDIENNTDVVEHSNVDTDRILIKDQGFYLIHYGFFTRTSGTTRDCESRVRKNDTSTVSGSYDLQNLYRDETHEQAKTFIAQLDVGDWITLQVQAGSTPVQTYSDYIFYAIKLEGIRGPKGDTGADGSIVGTLNLPALQIRKTGGISEIPLSWADITFDTTDVESYPNKIEHNNTNTDRVEIKEDGTYFITYSYEIDDEAFTRIRVNDNTTVVGSERHMGDVTQEGDLVAVVNHICITPLTAGDFITLQIYSTTTYEKILGDIILTVHKLEGIAGEKGDQGDAGPQGIQGPSGEASSINATGDLDEAQVTDIINNSGASSNNLYFYLVQNDTRVDDTSPTGISGDMSTHVVMYDGTNWSDIGAFVGIKGDTGDTGDTGPAGNDGADGADGNSVKVQLNNSDIMTNVAVMNFSGDVSINTDPGSKANIVIGGTNICQVYDSDGGTNVNNSTPIALPFNQQILKDSYYTHSTSVNNSRVQISTNGLYRIVYTMCCNGATNRRTVHSYIRKNGVTKLIISDSYSYARNSTDESESNHASFMVSLNAGDYIELMNEQDGTSGGAYAIANQSWLSLEFIRGV